METNPEIDQDRVFDTVDHFNCFGYVMFQQQVTIYQNIAKRINGHILEAGCGNGLGTAILYHYSHFLATGTDKLERNVKFAGSLYPWIDFKVWDINHPLPAGMSPSTVVVCVETIEHVEHPEQAIQNLIKAATEEVWISTPNGTGKPRPPSNKYHVCEYTPGEMLDMIARRTEILHWKDLSPLTVTTRVDPLVYRIKL